MRSAQVKWAPNASSFNRAIVKRERKKQNNDPKKTKINSNSNHNDSGRVV